jgi:hypothetical protein
VSVDLLRLQNKFSIAEKGCERPEGLINGFDDRRKSHQKYLKSNKQKIVKQNNKSETLLHAEEASQMRENIYKKPNEPAQRARVKVSFARSAKKGEG